jgi:hypothetical protein
MHGNAVAFRAALADVDRYDIDLIVSLGDVAQGGPQPKECVELLRELGCPCVFGNSDDFLLTLDLGNEPVEDEERRQRLFETAEWSRAQLGDEGLEFLRSFEPRVQTGDVLCCHATPVSNEDVILPVPFLPWSEYAIVDADLTVTFRRIPFDVDELIESARAKDFPHVERWSAQWRR